MSLIPVVMAGGSGTRLWPLSRQLYPKQFLPLMGGRTMLQETCDRLNGMECQPPLFICGEDHRFIVAEQLRSGGNAQGKILLEPEGRNTAPALALAACYALENAEEGSDPVLLVLAADHAIKDPQSFQSAVTQAMHYAIQDKLVTFGIVPSAPETGYGYIRSGAVLEDGPARVVDSFVEKPSRETAEAYLAEGGYFWNSGMFMFRAGQFLEELGNHRPDILSACSRAMADASSDVDFVRPDREAFLNCPEESIDYAVMEKTHSAVVVPMDCGWSDVGSWSALWEVSEKDVQGNTLKGDVVALDTH
ncbi:MAG: mannose-1-phosphate guanylyltransferase/mannose-6-phosphate isomerase, partial [Porticoccaceae bacterium]